jgi:hypothetical protein
MTQIWKKRTQVTAWTITIISTIEIIQKRGIIHESIQIHFSFMLSIWFEETL